MRRFTFLAVVSVAGALVGCPDWSRPDPRLQAGRPTAPRAAESDPGSEARLDAPPSAATPSPTAEGSSAAPARDVAALREGLRVFDPGAPDALERLERLEGLGFDLLEGGPPDEQHEVEALLVQLSDLRAELVERRRGS